MIIGFIVCINHVQDTEMFGLILEIILYNEDCIKYTFIRLKKKFFIISHQKKNLSFWKIFSHWKVLSCFFKKSPSQSLRLSGGCLERCLDFTKNAKRFLKRIKRKTKIDFWFSTEKSFKAGIIYWVLLDCS